MIRLDDINVYLITDDRRSGGRCVEDVVAAVVRGGVRMVQYRPRDVSDAQFLAAARRLREITTAAGALLLISDRADIAALCRADGIHIGAHDIPIKDARLLLGDDGIIGYSAHDPDEAKDAARRGANFITYSPVFPTTSSSKPRPALGPQAVIDLDVELPMPLFALGGIDHNNVEQLLELGVSHVAVVSCITEAKDIERAARGMCMICGQK